MKLNKSMAIAVFSAAYCVLSASGAGYPNTNARRVDNSAYGFRFVSAGLSHMERLGRSLFAAIAEANVDRIVHGRDEVWPQTGRTPYLIGSHDPDVADVSFKSATQFFRLLFDLKSEVRDWTPYLSADPSIALSTVGCRASLWNVALNLKEDTPYDVPVLISANFDCSKLPAKWPVEGAEVDRIIPIGTCPIAESDGIVVIYKDGATNVLPSDKVTLRNIYKGGGKNLVLPKQYLTPNGVVNVGQ